MKIHLNDTACVFIDEFVEIFRKNHKNKLHGHGWHGRTSWTHRTVGRWPHSTIVLKEKKTINVKLKI